MKHTLFNMPTLRRTTLFAMLLLGTTAMWAEVLNNPKDANGYYIVKYNCSTGTFASSNDMSYIETFVFAIDLTNTDNSYLQRAMNEDWTYLSCYKGADGYGNWYVDATNRLKRIEGTNIWAATYNLKKIDSGKSPTNIYTEIWNATGTWDYDHRVQVSSPGHSSLFKFASSDGRTESRDFTAEEIAAGAMPENTQRNGYIAPCIISEDVPCANCGTLGLEQ